MLSIHRESPMVSILLIAGGAFGVLFGFLLYTQRFTMASLLLNADFFLGMPVTRFDSLKVLVTTVQSFIAMGMSLLAIISGVVIAVLPSIRQGTTAAVPAVPHNR